MLVKEAGCIFPHSTNMSHTNSARIASIAQFTCATQPVGNKSAYFGNNKIIMVAYLLASYRQACIIHIDTQKQCYLEVCHALQDLC